ncbi:MAG: nitroreductase family protein [Halanaerobiales bacterium]|nr:nitroreductase family protein [Halanaerobiales bacterium]
MSMIKAMDLRKSIRKYQEKVVSNKDMESVKKIINEIKPLNSEIPMDVLLFEDGEKIKETFKSFTTKYAKVKSPHYLVFTSEKKEDYLENIGYIGDIGEQIILRLAELGIGTCWVGSPINQKVFKKIAKVKDNQDYIILIVFGYPEKPLTPIRKRSRLTKDKLVTGNIKDIYNPILDALQIAPSAINSQPWRIAGDSDVWDVYMGGKNIIMKKMLEVNNQIDMGIGISHIVLAGEELGYSVGVFKKDNVKEIKGQKYIGSIGFDFKKN